MYIYIYFEAHAYSLSSLPGTTLYQVLHTPVTKQNSLQRSFTTEILNLTAGALVLSSSLSLYIYILYLVRTRQDLTKQATAFLPAVSTVAGVGRSPRWSSGRARSRAGMRTRRARPRRPCPRSIERGPTSLSSPAGLPCSSEPRSPGRRAAYPWTGEE